MSAAAEHAFPAPPSRAVGAAPSPGGALETLAARVRPVSLARDQQVPVLPALASLVPGGALRRGTTVAVTSSPSPSPWAGPTSGEPTPAGPTPGEPTPGEGHLGGATALALALVAGASQAGSWVAAVGLGSLGLVAASGYGLATQRLALVDAPEPGAWAAQVAALVDGFDVVLVAAGPQVRRRPADARRLAARVRERGAVLVAVGGDLPERSRLQLAVTAGAWEGLDAEGYGHLTRRRVTVAAGGRGDASRPRRAELWLPAADGAVALVEEVAPAVPLTSRRPASRPAPVADLGASSRPGALRGRRRPVGGLRPAAPPDGTPTPPRVGAGAGAAS